MRSSRGEDPGTQLAGIVIGAGNRGMNAYAPFLVENPGLGLICGVAEPDADRRTAFAERYGVPADRCFESAAELLARPRFADFAIIATQDALHLEPALAALEAGYHVLLEKPMALSEAECDQLVDAAERAGRVLMVCHVLRYAPLYRAMHEAIRTGEIGRVVTIQHSENVSFWHYAHSYCRGSWRNRVDSSPMILSKSCHDLDLLYWFAGAPPAELSSVERPTELCAENAPADAPEFCSQGCPHSETCPYDAVAMYRDLTPLLLDLHKRTGEWEAPAEPPRASNPRGWPVSVLTSDPSPDAVDRALRETSYGRCVYRVGDNDQPASQSVSIRFRNGVIASFTLHSTSYREGRETRIDGTEGSIVAGFYAAEQTLRVHHHKTGAVRDVPLGAIEGGHGGGDAALMEGFLAAIRGERPAKTLAAESAWSHRMAFAADRCAREGSVARW